jgi:hypothetical protein
MSLSLALSQHLGNICPLYGESREFHYIDVWYGDADFKTTVDHRQSGVFM